MPCSLVEILGVESLVPLAAKQVDGQSTPGEALLDHLDRHTYIHRKTNRQIEY